MEFRRIRSYKSWLRIQTLILIFASTSMAAEIKSLSLENGLSGSLAFTDLDGGHIGAGTGYQLSLYSTWNIKKDWDLSISVQKVVLEQSLYTRADLSSTDSVEHLQQKWTLVGVGAQWSEDFWFYEYQG